MKLKPGKSLPPLVRLLKDSFWNLGSEQTWEKKHHGGGAGRVSRLGVRHLATMGMLVSQIVL